MRGSPEYMYQYNRGIMLLNSGKYKEALSAFETARNLWDSSYAYSGMGRAYYGLGKFDKALFCFEKAYCLYARNLQAVHWRAKTLGKLKRYDEAEDVFTQVLSILYNGGPMNFYQEVRTDYELMLDEKDTGMDLAPRGRSAPDMHSQNSQPAPRIIINGNQGPVNVGGIQATDDAVINRPTIDNSRNAILESSSSNQPLPQNNANDKQNSQETARVIRSGLFSYKCSNCGKSVKHGDTFCSNCGRKLV